MLDDIIHSDNAHEKMNHLIVFLEHYVKEHFDEEETIMKKAHYPGYHQHKLEHEYFSAFVENLRTLFDEHHHTQIIFQTRLLIDKLVRHIQNEDVGIKGIIHEKSH